MPANQAALEAIERYANGERHPEFAAALSGEWGCGKTHFVRGLIKRRDDQRRKSIYVSLYGMSQSQEIDESIFASLHPLLGGKTSKFMTRLLKGLVKTAIPIDFNSDGKPDATLSSGIPDLGLAEWMKPAPNTLIVFDDLERATLKIDQLLGYINNLVEHCEVRCLVVVNEDAMTASQRDDYALRKEKTIGLTVKILSEFDVACSEFADTLFGDHRAEFDQEWLPSIKAAFEQSERHNLRLLRQALLYFRWTYDCLPTNAANSNEVVRAYLSIHLPLAFEVLSGAVRSDQIADFMNLYGVAGYLAADQRKDDPIVKLARKYPRLNDYLRTELAAEFFLCLLRDGLVDSAKLSLIVNAHPALQNADTPSWRRLFFWADLACDQIELLAREVVKQLKSNSLENIYAILLACGTLMSISKREMASVLSIKQILTLGRQCIQAASVHDFHDYSKLGDLQIDTRSGHDGLGYPDDIPEFDQLRNFAESLRKSQFERFLQTQAELLLDEIKLRPASLAETTAQLNGMFSRSPLFSRLRVKDFVESLRSLTTVRDYWYVSDGFANRFRASNTEVYEPLLDELNFLEALDKELAPAKVRRYGRVASRGMQDIRARGLKSAISHLKSCKAVLAARKTS